MNRSLLPLAFITLIAVAILAYFGAAALAPLEKEHLRSDEEDLLAIPLDKPEIIFGNPTIGPKGALVTIVEFGDFLCDACEQLKDPMRNVLKRFEGQIRFVWKDFPNTDRHPEALNAAMAARCADRQGAFWEYHDILFDNQLSIHKGAYEIFAEELSLDINDFLLCMDRAEPKAIIEKDFIEGQRLRIDATPYLFIGENRITGALTETQLETFVRLELAKVRKGIGLPEIPELDDGSVN